MAKRKTRVCRQCKKKEETFSKSPLCMECINKNKKDGNLENDIQDLLNFGYQDVKFIELDKHNARIFEVLNPNCNHQVRMVMSNFRKQFNITGILSCSSCGGTRRAETMNTSKEASKKRKETCLERYGVEHIMQNWEFQELIKDNRFERTGFRNCMQDPKVFEKTQSHRSKNLTLPSGKNITYQGYENIAIDELLKTYKEKDLELRGMKIPTVWYEEEGIRRRYYPDIYIPKEHKIIEVKSTFTYNRFLNKNILKKEACVKEGYKFEFWICSNKELLEILS